MGHGTIACMFAMLRGPWPRVTADGRSLADLEAGVAAGSRPAADLEAAIERLVAEAVGAQVESGMDLVTDGSVRWADPAKAVLAAFAAGDTGPGGMLVRSWKAAAAITDANLAQVVPGPVTLALREVGAWGDLNVVNGQALAHAATLAGEIAALRDAGCPVIIVDEPAAVGIGANPRARDGFVRAHTRLLRETDDLHVMLSVAGGSAHALGAEAVFGLAYHSFCFDLVAGPDNWYLVRAAPESRGIVCAALTATADKPLGDQSPQLVWAAQYAASANARGLDRVGIANASSLAGLSPAEARAALDAMAKASEFAVMPLEAAVKAGFDEKALRVMPGLAKRADAS